VAARRAISRRGPTHASHTTPAAAHTARSGRVRRARALTTPTASNVFGRAWARAASSRSSSNAGQKAASATAGLPTRRPADQVSSAVATPIRLHQRSDMALT
jgi:hypothetical protein